MKTKAVLEQENIALRQRIHELEEMLARQVPAQAEMLEARQRLTERLELATRAAQIGIWDWDIPNNQLVWDDRMYALYGISPGEFGGAYEAWLNGVHPDDRAVTGEASSRALRGEAEYDTEFRVLWRDGSVHWLKANGLVVRDEHGAPVRMLGVNYDITERKRAEQDLRASEQRYAAIFEKSAVPTVLVQLPQVVIADANRAAQDLLDLTKQALLGKTAAELGLVRTAAREQSIQRFEQNGQLQGHEITAKTATGRDSIVVINTNRIELDGKPFALTTLYDVTERILAEQKLRESTQRYVTLFESSPLPIGISRLKDGQFTEANPALLKLMGYTRQEVIGHRSVELGWWGNSQDRTILLERIVSEQRVDNFETCLLTKSGDQRSVLLSAELVALNQEPSLLIQATDITARKQAEIALARQAERINILHQIDMAILSMESIAQISNKTLEMLAVIIPFDLGVIAQFDSALMQYRLIAARGDAGFDIPFNEPLTIDARLMPRLSKTGLQIEPDLKAYARDDYLAQPFVNAGMQSFIHTAIEITPTLIFGFRLFSRMPDAFTAQHGEIFDEVLRQLAIALHQMRMRAQIQQHAADLERRVREATAEVSELYNNAPGGYHSLDAQGRIVFVNDTELNWLGRTRAQVLGHSFTEFIAPHQMEQFYLRHLPAITAGIPIQDLEYDLVSSDGSTLPVLLKATAVMDANGGFVMSRATLIDITERRQAEQALRFSRDQLNLANRELERAAKLKNEFLANMSHELRTPLNAILGLSQTLLEHLAGPLTPRQTEAVQVIESSGTHLLSLINDILDLSKIEAGSMTLDSQRVEMHSLCEASLAFVKQMAFKKKIRLRLNPDTTVEWIEADPRRLKQMLVNLLTNAVKFTPNGGQVELSTVGNREQQTVQFLVKDSGIGIAPQDLSLLFKPFSQIDSSMTRQFEGTGLGLALVAQMAQLHGGSVSVESEIGKGSTFCITLPWQQGGMAKLSDSAASGETDNAQRASSAGSDAPLILVADDNQSNLLAVSIYLEANGFRIASAHNGMEALEKIHFERPALVLVDLQMPVLDGLTAIERLRRDSSAQIARLPIIAVTALAMPGDRERALAAGADEYVSKPIDLKQLVAVMKQLLRR